MPPKTNVKSNSPGSPDPKANGKPPTTNNDTLYWPAKVKQLNIDLQDLSAQVGALRRQLLNSDGQQSDRLKLLEREIEKLVADSRGKTSDVTVNIAASDLDRGQEYSKSIDGALHERLSMLEAKVVTLVDTAVASRVSSLDSQLRESIEEALGKRKLPLDDTLDGHVSKLDAPIDRVATSQTSKSNSRINEQIEKSNARIKEMIEDALAKKMQSFEESLESRLSKNGVLTERASLLDSQVHTCVEQYLAKRALSSGVDSDAPSSKIEALVDKAVADRASSLDALFKAVADRTSSLDAQVQASIEQALAKRGLSSDEAKIEALVDKAVANRASSLDALFKAVTDRTSSLDAQVQASIEQALAKRGLSSDEASGAPSSKIEALVDKAVADRASSLDAQAQASIENALAKRGLSSDEASGAPSSNIEALVDKAMADRSSSLDMQVQASIDQILAKRRLSSDEDSGAPSSKIEALIEKALVGRASSLDTQVQASIEQALAKRGLSQDEASGAPSSKIDALVDKAVANKASLLDAQVQASIEQALLKRPLSLDQASEARIAKLETFANQAAASQTASGDGLQGKTPANLDAQVNESIEHALAKHTLAADKTSEARFAKLEALLEQVASKVEKKSPQRVKKPKRASGETYDDDLVGESQQEQKPDNETETNISSPSQASLAIPRASPKTKLRAVSNMAIAFPKEKAKARSRDVKETTSTRRS